MDMKKVLEDFDAAYSVFTPNLSWSQTGRDRQIERQSPTHFPRCDGSEPLREKIDERAHARRERAVG